MKRYDKTLSKQTQITPTHPVANDSTLAPDHNHTKDDIPQLFESFKNRGMSFYCFTDAIANQNDKDTSMSAQMWLCGRMDIDNGNHVYIEDAKAYISLYDYIVGAGISVSDFENWLNYYGEYYYVDAESVKNKGGDIGNSTAHPYTAITGIHDTRMKSLHILMYKLNSEDACNLLIPCSSMSYFDCIINVFTGLVKGYPAEHEAHTIMMDRYDDLTELLEPHFNLTPEQTIEDGDESPIFRINRQYWMQFCPTLANLTHANTGSMN